MLVDDKQAREMAERLRNEEPYHRDKSHITGPLLIEAANLLEFLSAQIAELKKALVHLEQAYRNKHSPQHRSAALDEASGLIAKLAAKESGVSKYTDSADKMNWGD